MSKTIYFILGMHRSGTSLVSNILVELGINAGSESELIGASESNPSGHFELCEMVKTNDNILIENGFIWHMLVSPNYHFDTSLRMKMSETIEGWSVYREGEKLLVKDPRLCYLGELWKTEFEKRGDNCRAIVVVRHPIEVAESLYKRDGISIEYGLALFCVYNLHMLFLLREYSMEDMCILNHSELFMRKESCVDSISNFCMINNESRKAQVVINNNYRHQIVVGDTYENYDNSLLPIAMEIYKSIIKIESSNDIKGLIKKYKKEVYEICNKYNYREQISQCSKTKYREINQWYICTLGKKKIIISDKLQKLNRSNSKEVIIYGAGVVFEYIKEYLPLEWVYLYVVDVNKKGQKTDIQNKEIAIIDEITNIDLHNRILLNTAILYEKEISRLWIEKGGEASNYITVFDLVF